MPGLLESVFKVSLSRRIFNSAIQGDTGMVCLFSQHIKWLRLSVEQRSEPERVRALQAFLHATERPAFKPDDSKFNAFMKWNEGQPQAVRALNLREDAAGNPIGWKDNPEYEPPGV